MRYISLKELPKVGEKYYVKEWFNEYDYSYELVSILNISKDNKIFYYLVGESMIRSTNDNIFYEEDNSIKYEDTKYLLDRLDKLYNGPVDEPDETPITESAYLNSKLIIMLCDEDHLLDCWNIFPNFKGAVSFEFQATKFGLSSICVSDNQISYFVKVDNKIDIKGIEPFSIEAVKSILKKI